MRTNKRPFSSTIILAIVPVLLMSCQFWAPLREPQLATLQPTITQVSLAQPRVATAQHEPKRTPTSEPEPTPDMESPQQVVPVEVPAGEPAGCFTAEAQAALDSPMAMLARADSLLDLKVPLTERLAGSVWNAATGEYDFSRRGAYAISVGDVQNEYLIQTMMNAMHVSGFVTWLRTGPGDSMHILAIPVTSTDVLQPDFRWGEYVSAYWRDRFSLPAHDTTVIQALKLPPCRWMIDLGTAPQVHSGWWSAGSAGWPDYAWAAGLYTATDTHTASLMAQKIDWLGPDGVEAANTMCGPLSWAIMNDVGAFPPGIGGWSSGGISFWLAKPLTNGRPWSIFPPGTYTVHHFREPLSKFDFGVFPLYPGDFLYLYSKKDGFDHMLLVTEVDADGNVYTVTNLVKVHPEEKTTIERVVLYNANNPSVGIARNAWAKDGRNGRTGHDGFDVFRWAWMEKDISGQPAAYTVQVGDTLGLISERWKTPAAAIAEYNGIQDDAMDSALAIGQVLKIPPNADFLVTAASGR